MINNPLFSIIIPVYNMELYLERCINSIINQTYKKLEIIVINDGSTDNSLNILKSFSKKDNRVVVIDKNNEGIGGACLDGLSIAKGDYISFVDSDDYCELNTYEILSNYLKEHDVDLVQFCDRHFNSENETIGMWFTLPKKLLLNNTEIINYQFEIIKVPSLACKIFKKNLFEGIDTIKQNIGIDHLLTYQILLKSKSMLVIPDRLYNVFVRTDSVSRSAYNESSITQSIILFKKLIHMFSNKNNPILLNHILCHYLNLTMVLGKTVYVSKKKKNYLIDFVKNTCEFDKYYKMNNNLFSNDLNYKFRMKTFFFKLNPYLYYYLYDLLKK